MLADAVFLADTTVSLISVQSHQCSLDPWMKTDPPPRLDTHTAHSFIHSFSYIVDSSIDCV